MKQLLQNLRSGETLVADVPIPAPQYGEVLVKTAASLVSAGTERTLVSFAEKNLVGKARSRPDLVRQVLDKARREGFLTTVEAAFNKLDQPMPLGYSSAGMVVALGDGVEGIHVGQRVACAGGNYAVHAEYAAVPHILVTPLPDKVAFEVAAFTTLGAIAMHGYRLAEVQLGERVAVIGLGLLGLLMVSIARAAGCRVLGIDLNPDRVLLAEKLGAEAVLRNHAEDAAQVFSSGRGCDAVLICADTKSDDPVELAGTIARDKAKVVAVGAVGLTIPRKIYYEKELTLVNSRSYGPGRYDPSYEEEGKDYPIGYVRWTEGRNMESFVDLLAEELVDVLPLITHRYPIEQAPDAYDLITGKREESFLGVLLTYPDSTTEDADHRRVVIPRAGSSKPLEGYILRAGVLGAGGFASAVLLPALKGTPGVYLVGIASASGFTAAHAARKFGFRYAASREEELLQDPDVNTIFVLTRHNLHARQVCSALSLGKNVFCEKPLALNREELDDIEEALQGGQGGLLTVGFNRRFAPLAQKLKAFFASSPEPLIIHYRVNAGYIPASHWVHDPVQGGGRMIGEGCHFVDFLVYLNGEVPISVQATGIPDLGRYREDNVVLSFEFPNGSVGVVSYLANGDKAFPKERVEVFGGGRAAVLDDYRKLELVHEGRRETVKSRMRQDKGHTAELNAFAAAVGAGGPAPIPYEQIFGVHQAVFAAVEALRSGERKILEG
ncbi:MAG: hypothetical protein EHM41_00770 [Chloroflexi bacterium]|nr:MAG: hypothetical protein EHM41_00770 [Chloroflexota bacterium]